MTASQEQKLETSISYVLVIGVIVSLVTEIIGIITYYNSQGNLGITFGVASALTSTGFFSYIRMLLQVPFSGQWQPVDTLGLGIVILMLTPYLRVAASVVYFAIVKNRKYLGLTLLVLVILTASLVLR